MKKTLINLLRAFVSIVLLIVLFKKIDLHKSVNLILHADFFYFILIFIAFGAVYTAAFFRWKMLLDARGIRISRRHLVGAFCGGVFMNSVLPSTVGGDIARSLDLSSYTNRRSMIVATVLLDRISGFVGLVLVAIVSLFFGFRYIDEPAVYGIVVFLALMLTGVLVVIFNKRIYQRLSGNRKANGGFREKLKSLHDELYFFRSKPQVIVSSLLLSALIQAGSGLIAYLAFLCLHVDINIFIPFVLTPVISTITTLPISIGGVGLRENASVYFYAKVANLTHELAGAQAILNTALLYLFALIAAIVYVSILHYRRIQSHQADERPE